MIPIKNFERSFLNPQINKMLRPPNKRAEYVEDILLGILFGMIVYDFISFN